MLFGIFTFFFFSYLNFPYHKIKDKLFSQLEKQTDIKIDVDEFKTTLLLGLEFSGVNIQSAHDFFEINIPSLSIHPSLLSLITFKPKIQFTAEFPKGSITGFFHHKGATYQKIDLEFGQVDIKEPFQGVIDGKLWFDGNLNTFKGIEGETHLQIKNFTLDKTSIMGFVLPQISLSQMTLKGGMKKDLFVIQTFEAGNDKDPLKASLSGDIALNPQNINMSRLNLKLKFKMSDALKEEFKLFLPLLQGALDPSGYYSLNITGTLTAPMALPIKG